MERVVKRDELVSEESAPPSSPEISNIQNVKEFEYVKKHNGQSSAGNETAETGENNEDEMDFLLFAPTASKTEIGPTIAKIRIQTPPPINAEPGFLAVRDQTYYFTTPLSTVEKVNLIAAAVTGEDVRARSRSAWPGSAYSWKVLHVPETKTQRAILPNDIVLFAKVVGSDTATKRKRPGKKSRILKRTKLAAANAKREEGLKAAEAKEIAEREKRTRRNREKKVKKRIRDKAKKVAGEDEEGSSTELEAAQPD